MNNTETPHCDNCDLTKIPQVVKDSIKNNYPKEYDEIMADLKYSHMNGCYFFNRWGMYVGVEVKDGYIHT